MREKKTAVACNYFYDISEEEKMADDKKAATAEKKAEPVESKSVYTICNFLYLSVHISLFVILGNCFKLSQQIK